MEDVVPWLHLLRLPSWSLDREPEWLANSIIETIASLPLLTEFTIKYSYRSEAYPSLHLLKNLTKLSVHGRSDDFRGKIVTGVAQAIAGSPNIKHLDFDSDAWWGRGREHSLHDLFSNVSVDSTLKLQNLGLAGIRVGLDARTIRHLRSLTSLQWMRNVVIQDNNYVNSTEGLWHTLKTERIQLAELKTDQMSDDLLQYLSSYEGLRDLRLDRISGKDDDDSNRLADTFFQEVLPRHRGSLEILHIDAAYEGNWVSLLLIP